MKQAILCALMVYGLAAVISFLVAGLIKLIAVAMKRFAKPPEPEIDPSFHL